MLLKSKLDIGTWLLTATLIAPNMAYAGQKYGSSGSSGYGRGSSGGSTFGGSGGSTGFSKPSYTPSVPKTTYTTPSIPKTTYTPSVPKTTYTPSVPKAVNPAPATIPSTSLPKTYSTYTPPAAKPQAQTYTPPASKPANPPAQQNNNNSWQSRQQTYNQNRDRDNGGAQQSNNNNQSRQQTYTPSQQSNNNNQNRQQTYTPSQQSNYNNNNYNQNRQQQQQQRKSQPQFDFEATRRNAPAGSTVENRGNHAVITRPDGTRSVVSATKRTEYRADGSKAQSTRNGVTTQYNRDGEVTRQQYKGGKTVVYGTTSSGRVDRTNITVTHGNTTIVQRQVNNTTIIRNYNYGGRTYARNYNVYVDPYYGVTYHQYYRGYYYTPSYYSYLYSSWTPAYYTYHWSWYTPGYVDPWYSHYGYYYHPYATYVRPSYWLTDYLISDILRTSYENRLAQAQRDAQQAQEQLQQAQQAQDQAQMASLQAQLDRTKAQLAELQANQAQQSQNQQQVAINDQIKEQINKQVEEAMQAAQAQQQNGAPVVSIEQHLADPNRIYLVNDDTDASAGDLDGDGDNDSCDLSEGDLIKLERPLDPASNPNDRIVAPMVVVTSKKGDCPAGSHVTIAKSDLQEMENEFQARLEPGMKKMQEEHPQQ